jgi:acetyl esterase
VRQRLLRAAIHAVIGSDRFVRFAGQKRSKGIDFTLDRQIAAALEYQRIMKMPPLESMTPAGARKFAEEGLSVTELVPEKMAEIVDTTAGGVPVRLFVPHGASHNWIVYLHGGGGVIGSVRASEPITRYLASHTRCTVASVEYRLGPEHPHPAAVDDSIAAWTELVARVPAGGKIAVAGDSFGGYLAAQVDHLARARGVRQPDVQGLVYPLVDMTLTSPSIDKFANGYLLTKPTMLFFRDHYLGSQDQRAASPQFWPSVAGSAPAIVVTAGFDPLVDEGDAWAARLRAEGITVRHRRHDSLVHGFLSLAGAVRAARVAVDQLVTDLVEMME